MIYRDIVRIRENIERYSDLLSCIHYLIMSFKDFNLSYIYYLIMPFKDFNYMYSSFLIQRCHLYYFSSSPTRANTQTYARSLAHSLTH